MQIDVNNKKKIITIDIAGELTEELVNESIQEISKNIEKLLYKGNINLREWRINLYTCHMIMKNRKEYMYMKDLIDNIVKYKFKIFDIIISKAQKTYKEHIGEIVDKYYSNKGIKLLNSNNIFKFNVW